ncbi:hypothetical protein ACI2JA_13285 [Alkalihalobacillus sp. NPDC078783]
MIEYYKKAVLFSAFICYICAIGGVIFLLIKGKELIEYNVSAGAMPILILISVLMGILLTFQYKKL